MHIPGAAMGENLPWFRMFPTEWLSDISSMKASEIALYTVLILTMHREMSPLPLDERRMARKCGMTVSTFQEALQGLLKMGLIVRKGDTLWSEKAQAEMDYAHQKSESSRRSAKKRWEEKPNKINGGDHANALPPHSERNASKKLDTDTDTDKNHPSDGNAQARDPTPRELLLTVLSPETADAVIQHRKSKRAPLSTLLAARGLVNAFKEFPDGPEAAAALMVTSGWTGFKREFWDKRPAMGGQRRMTAAEETGQRLAQRIEEMNHAGRPDQSSEGSGDLWGSKRLLAAGGQAHRPPFGQLR
jgi:hypothetical protein